MTTFAHIRPLLTQEEYALLQQLDTPWKIQSYINSIPHNFEEDGDSCLSVRGVIAKQRAHCIEAALLAACCLWANGEAPLIMDLSANDRDDDHVVAVFRRNGRYGAISKGNHAYLRYRDPVYRSLRELALSYFHEYYNAAGEKTLRTYSRTLSLAHFDPAVWITGGDAWAIAEATCDIHHYQLLSQGEAAHLRPIDDVQLRTMSITEHQQTVRSKTRRK